MDNNYKHQVINTLKKKISTDDSNVRKDYLYNEKEGRAYRFDLVELDQEDKIKKLYVVCRNEDLLGRLNALLNQLRLYHSLTDAEAFLVFADIFSFKTELNVLSLDELERLGKQRCLYVDTFVDFYKALPNPDVYQKPMFRGQSNNKYEPIPSIYRGINIFYEEQYYHEAIRRCPKEFTEEMTTFDNLVKMQHYELPTRLLDITTNPLVALYFACQKEQNEDRTDADGEVLVYTMNIDDIKYYDSKSVSLLADLAKRPVGYKPPIYKTNGVSEVINPEANEIHKVQCVLPKLNNERILNQDGAFFIFGMGEVKNEPASLPELPKIINIKANAKEKILAELRYLGIDESFMFPETDKIMNQIKQQFHKQFEHQHASDFLLRSIRHSLNV